ncbi:MAG: PD-(D/E)XK nuclease family protein [Pirellulales bacterium]
MHPTTIVAGVAGAGKTRWLLERYRAALVAGPPGAALWLAPTERAAALIRQQLLRGGARACLNPQCLTFHQFARRVLDSSRLPLRPLGLLGQRQILRERIAEALRAGELRYFAPIAHTGGFLDLVVGLIQEFKRLEIWPEELRDARGTRANAKDRELFHLYDQYQQVLNEHDLYDMQGRFWSARAEMRNGRLGRFAAVRQVFVDGFVDFTRTEHEMLEILAGRVDSMAISLPLEIGPRRAELFAKSAATLNELQKRYPDMQVVQLARRDGRVESLAHVEQFLFANPRDVAPPPAAHEIEIVPTAGVTAEIEWLARRVKALLVDGEPAQRSAVRPGDVLVVFRTLTDETCGLVRQVFAEFGLPLALASRASLGAAPAARTLAAWLQLDAEDWSFGPLLSLLVHDYFRPDWPEWQDGRAAWAAEALVRRLQIPAGRAALLAQVERIAAAAARRGAADGSSATLRDHQALLAAPFLARLAQMLDALPQRATLNAWITAVTNLANDSGLLRRRESTLPPAEVQIDDAQAWQALIAGLEELERASRWLGRDAELSRREFAEQLQEVLRSQPLPADADEAGRVRVLSADSARHVSAPYVFVAGLSERSFPPGEHEDCLYGDLETRELVAAGLPLAPRTERRWHEMLLFYQVVTRATRRLVLSYPALDEAAQPLSASPYLSELERVFASRPIVPAARPSLSAVPTSDVVYSPREFRVRATARALEGDGALLARLAVHPQTASTARAMLAGLETVSSRRDAKGFGSYEGMFTSDAARAALAQRFGAEHCWSPSQLEQYALCPHQFFLQRVLGVEPCDDPELTVDYAGRGQLLHGLLAKLHRRLNDTAGRPTSPGELAADAFDAMLQQSLTAALDLRTGDRPLADGLLEIDVRRMAAQLVEYYRQHADYDALFADFESPLKPAHFEVSFGPQRGADPEAGEMQDAADALASEAPFELVHLGETIRFSGRIDRIDLGRVAGQIVFSIIDYKTGRSEGAKAAAILDGTALQLPLYALAAQKLLAGADAVPAHIGYWHVAGKGCNESIRLSEHDEGRLRDSAAWQALLNELPKRLLSLVRGVRDGQFPMASADAKCTSRCAYRTVCRVNQVRSLGKDQKWQPPAEIVS